MKKILISALICCVTLSLNAQKKWFVGGTIQAGYLELFQLGLETQIGYEFTDHWAIGTGVGMTLASSGLNTVVLGLVEPYIRLCTWHNDRVFIDLKATSGFGFDSELVLCQVGLTPSLRFRLSEHCDVATDFGLFGAQYSYGNWSPDFGINAVSATLWFLYRF